MGTLNVRRRLAYSAVAAALGLAASSADALRFVGTFDPVSFSGAYDIDVDPDCLSSDGWKANAGGPINPGDSICSIVLESASAFVTSTFPDPVFSGNVTFAPPALGLPQVLGVNVVSGTVALDAFDTELLSWVSSDFGFDGSMYIKFTSGAMDDPYTCGNPLPAGVTLYTNVDPCVGEPDATAVFTSIRQVDVVPEPGTLSLLLGALGGGYLARRRKKRSPD